MVSCACIFFSDPAHRRDVLHMLPKQEAGLVSVQRNRPGRDLPAPAR